MNNVKEKLQFSILCLIVYLYIYGPPFRFLPVNISLLLSLIPFLTLLHDKKIFHHVINTFRAEVFSLFLISVYCIFIGALNHAEYVFYSPFIIFLFYFPMSIWLSLKLSDSLQGDFYSDKLIKKVVFTLAICTLVSSLISIFLFLNPELNTYIKFQVLKYNETIWQYQLHRGFGIADELLFTFSIVQASVLILYIIYFPVGVFSLILFITVLVSILLNARIGLLFLMFLPFAFNYNLRTLFNRIPWFFVILPFLTFLFMIQYDFGSDSLTKEFKFLLDQFEYFFFDLFNSDS